MSRLSAPSEAGNGQAQRPARAAAPPSGGKSMARPAIDWSSESILAYGPTVMSAEDGHSSISSMYGAGDWHQHNSAASTQDHPAPEQDAVTRSAVREYSDAAQSTAMAAVPPSAEQQCLQADAGISLLPSHGDLAGTSHKSQKQDAVYHQEARPAPSLHASMRSNSSSSSLSQQDKGSALRTASTSSSSCYTKADSLISKACSSPRQNGASVSQNCSCMRDQPSVMTQEYMLQGRDMPAANIQPAPVTNISDPAAHQVCPCLMSAGHSILSVR